MQRLFALHLDCDSALHHKIGTETAVQFDGFIDQWHRLLPFHPKSEFLNLISHASLIRGLEKPRPQLAMYLDRRSDNLRSKIARVHTRLLYKAALLRVFRGRSLRTLRLSVLH